MRSHLIIATLTALAIAFVSVGAAATPAEAGWVEGWYTFYGTATKTRTIHERSPLKTRFVLKLQQKRAATTECRARVIVVKGPWLGRSEVFVKPSRGAWDWHAGYWDWEGDRTRKTTVKVKTNGNCQYRIWFR